MPLATQRPCVEVCGPLRPPHLGPLRALAEAQSRRMSWGRVVRDARADAVHMDLDVASRRSSVFREGETGRSRAASCPARGRHGTAQGRGWASCGVLGSAGAPPLPQVVPRRSLPQPPWGIVLCLYFFNKVILAGEEFATVLFVMNANTPVDGGGFESGDRSLSQVLFMSLWFCPFCRTTTLQSMTAGQWSCDKVWVG